jgi:DNA-binding LacI/PurR family transcriptional regulator
VATIKAVAKLAGVSPSTVSYVLSGARPIGPETRARVLDAVEVLGYQPNSSALALRTARTKVLALHGFAAAGHTESAVTGLFLLAVADAVRERGYDLLLIPTNEGAAGIERLARTARADAVLLMGILMRDQRVDALRRLRFPAALIGHPEGDPGISWVDLDFAAAGSAAVELLSRQGHRECVYLGPPANVYAQGAGYAVRAWQGAQQAALANGVKLEKLVHIEDVRHVGSTLDELFAGSPEPTAIVLQYEEVLPEVLRWLRAHRRRVPEDVLVVLVGAWRRDNTESQVTNVSSTVTRVASAAVDLAIDAATDGEVHSVLLSPEVWVSRQ